MQLIPVIDVAAGQVVHAVRGERDSYHPVHSALVANADPLDVARALLRYTRSAVLYVADIDALTGGEPQRDALRSLIDAFPATQFWIDGGFVRADDAARLLQAIANATPVFASESLADDGEPERCFASFPDAILSLDRRNGQRLDRAGLWTSPELWPRRVIVMTLDRVGSAEGPDLETLDDVRRRAAHRRPKRDLIGAGGLRNDDDVRAAERAGASAWLAASALHDLALTPPCQTLRHRLSFEAHPRRS